MNIKGKGIVKAEDTKKKKAKKSSKRAKDKKGQFLADDPSTLDINEAWVSGVSPAKDSDS